ncbi:hypothetical protein HHK36_002301 [Tetracentron sinense]|uniref:Uncharacterized protein n=1 Tax=Tetracentron sinense TaxID=13715 RepID=A0A834ZU90_TETSI|nr:hypothetical protein HHK36_002301 [Tetracentron sinense]
MVQSPVAYITPVKTQLFTKPAPFMASFSSKGPNTVTPEILKVYLAIQTFSFSVFFFSFYTIYSFIILYVQPDITAPGVNVIAAYTEAESPTNQAFDKRRIPFNSISGTSMSCPHVSGIVGLLKTLHPNWSPSAIRSAIMTTARTRDNNMEPMLNSSFVKATPFSYGAGHVRPNRAMDPGLVYDLTTNDYLNFLCTLGYNQTQISLFSDGSYTCPKKNISLIDFNYPSITVPKLSGSATVTRTIKNVGSPGTYIAHVLAPAGIFVTVEPPSLKFEKMGEEKTFKLSFKTNLVGAAAREYLFGQLTWSDGEHNVRSPIVVKVAS